MSFTFIFSNDYNLGIQQLMSILNLNRIRTSIVLSKYTFLELSYLHYLTVRGHEQERIKARFLLDQDIKEIILKVQNSIPAVVGFSVTTDMYRWSLEVATKLKDADPDCPIIMGGAHPTFAPEVVIRQRPVDAICRGEVDSSIVDIYESLSSHKPPRAASGTWLKSNGSPIKNEIAPLVEDLNSLPFIDIDSFAALNPQFSIIYNTISARGCPFNCSYCNSASLKRSYRGKGKYLRKRSPENLLAELQKVKTAYGPQEMAFIDDVFTMDHSWLRKFLPVYQETIGLPFKCLIHPESVDDATLELMRDSGCISLKVGIQSLDPFISKKVFNRNCNINKITHIIAKIKELGMEVRADFIIGAPYETEEHLRNLVNFIKNVPLDDIFLYFLKYYPGADIIDTALQGSLLNTDDISKIYEGKEVSYQIVPDRYNGDERALYEKYNYLIRAAAKSKFKMTNFSYLLDSDAYDKPLASDHRGCTLAPSPI